MVDQTPHFLLLAIIACWIGAATLVYTTVEPYHQHTTIGEPYCIAQGTLCDSLRYCETTNKKIIFKDTHVNLTKEDSSKYNLTN